MDMIEEELDSLAKDRNKEVNFNLHRFVEIQLYTKWKRNRMSNKERE